MTKLDITMEVLVYVSAVLLICAGTSAPPDLHSFKDLSVKNFGCKLGESRLHVENGPNCPCGNYAVDCHKKDANRQDIKQRKTPFWSLRDGKLQYYYCDPCSMCDIHYHVLAKCSLYNDTKCGSECEDPYQRTNAGCFMHSLNISNVNDATYTTESNEQIRMDNTTHPPPPNTIPKESICFSHESFVICAVAMGVVSLVGIVLVCLLFRCCKPKRSTPTSV